MKDGRSKPPPMPMEYNWIQLTAAINRRTGSQFGFDFERGVWQVQLLPSDQLNLLVALLQYG